MKDRLTIENKRLVQNEFHICTIFKNYQYYYPKLQLENKYQTSSSARHDKFEIEKKRITIVDWQKFNAESDNSLSQKLHKK